MKNLGEINMGESFVTPTQPLSFRMKRVHALKLPADYFWCNLDDFLDD